MKEREELIAAALGLAASRIYLEAQTTPGAHDDAELELRQEIFDAAAYAYVKKKVAEQEQALEIGG